MTDQHRSLVREWYQELKELDEQYTVLNTVLMPDPSSPFTEGAHKMMDSYTKVISLLIGDDGEWLKWFHLECYLGAKPLSALIKDTEILADDVEKIIEIIEGYNAIEEEESTTGGRHE